MAEDRREVYAALRQDIADLDLAGIAVPPALRRAIEALGSKSRDEASPLPDCRVIPFRREKQ